MELIKENIHENRIKNKATVQFTLDDDYNVLDALPDIEQIVKERGRIHIESVRVNGDKADVTGALEFSLLYMAQQPVSMKGKMDFHENINVAELIGDEVNYCDGEIEDLTIKTINSRKISIKAIISLTVISERIEDTSIVTEIESNDNSISSPDMLQMLKKDIEYAEIKVNGKDNFRIRENVQLPTGKPNVAELLWSDTDIKSLDTRLTDNGLMVNGEITFFVLYRAADENESMQWFETTSPFEGTVDTSGSASDMIVYVKYTIQSCEVEVKPDYDDEDRMFSIEMVLDMDIKGYEEKAARIVEDIYSPVKQVIKNTNPAVFRKLLVRNNSKCRTNQRVKVNGSYKLLSICNCTGAAKIEDVTVTEEGLEVDGVTMINIFYITSDDNMPMGSIKDIIPFHHKIQVKGMKDGTVYDYSINVNLEQLTAVMSGSDEIEVKAVIGLDTICFEPIKKDVIESIDLIPMEDSDYFKLPSIVGYISNGEDTLWDVAKRYHTTTDLIKSSNKLSTDRLNKGDKLILVKAMR